MPKKNQKKKERCDSKLVIKDFKNKKEKKEKKDNKELLSKTKKEMITYKRLQNIDLTTYDIIFSSRQFENSIIEGFASFKALLQEIKKQFKPELLFNKNISAIKKKENSLWTNII